MPRSRDTQKSRLYRAENGVVCNKHAPDSVGKPAKDFASITECQKYVDRIRGSAWMKKNFPQTARADWKLIVERGRGCHCGISVMTLASWGFDKGVVLHELAHCIVSRDVKGNIGLYAVKTPCAIRNRNAAAHGREYAQVYLLLVARFMGRAKAAELKARFKAWKVKYRPKRKIDPAVAQAAAARLASYRKAKRQVIVAQAACQPDGQGTTEGPPELVKLLRF